MEIKKGWGKEILMTNTEKYCGKLLYVEKGKRSDMHFHRKKDKTFYVLSGKILMEIWKENEDIEKMMGEGDSVRIKPKQTHRFNGLEDSVMIEISTPDGCNDYYKIDGMFEGNIPKFLIEEYLEGCKN